MTGTLYLIPTPIGNLGDITERACQMLRKVDLIACEDTRNTQKLLGLFGIKTSAPLWTYHEYNADKMRPTLIEKLLEGIDIGLVSDAGTPLISDPGYRLVKDCIEHDITVVPLPGANAVLPALLLSGLASDRFLFNGFLPNKSSARKTELSELKNIPATLIFYESPHRVLDTLKDMLAVFGERDACVVRELTKKFEERKSGKISELIEFYNENGDPKGEIVIVVARGDKKEEVSFDIHALLKEALKKNTSLRDAVDEVTQATGLDRRKIYKEALDIQKNG
ncbi:MAG: 16S rRNA (cytidine(1402)-2'-O)-methyltransferase [Alphaproteobacteria bacterium]|nr:16S rRNA (cytidine(1402)-2'-O)-methyltransferase [Alphaproteobacteria bacterium]